MTLFMRTHSAWVLLAILVIVITVMATVYSFWRKRYIDNGPRKGEAANPARVKLQNPPDR